MAYNYNGEKYNLHLGAQQQNGTSVSGADALIKINESRNADVISGIETEQYHWLSAKLNIPHGAEADPNAGFLQAGWGQVWMNSFPTLFFYHEKNAKHVSLTPYNADGSINTGPNYQKEGKMYLLPASAWYASADNAAVPLARGHYLSVQMIATQGLITVLMQGIKFLEYRNDYVQATGSMSDIRQVSELIAMSTPSVVAGADGQLDVNEPGPKPCCFLGEFLHLGVSTDAGASWSYGGGLAPYGHMRQDTNPQGNYEDGSVGCAYGLRQVAGWYQKREDSSAHGMLNLATGWDPSAPTGRCYPKGAPSFQPQIQPHAVMVPMPHPLPIRTPTGPGR